MLPYKEFEKIAALAANSTMEAPEDIAQEMALACIERAEKSPDFFFQNKSYVVHCGRLRLWSLLREKRMFDRYQFYALEDDEGNTVLDFIAGDELSPEDELIQKQELEDIISALDALSERERIVINLVVAGVKTKDVAERLGITPAAVSVYKARARKKILRHMCAHENTRWTVLGGVRTSYGEYDDNIREVRVCQTCGEILQPEEDSAQEFENVP